MPVDQKLITTAIEAARAPAHGDGAAVEETLHLARLAGPEAVMFLHYVVRTEGFASPGQCVRAACTLLEVGGFIKSTGPFREPEGADGAPERDERKS